MPSIPGHYALAVTIELQKDDVMVKRRDYYYKSLAAAIENQRNQPTGICSSCQGEKKLVERPYTFPGLVVWNMLQYECIKCGAVSHRLSVSIAIEHLLEKFNLRGGCQMKELLEIERNSK